MDGFVSSDQILRYVSVTSQFNGGVSKPVIPPTLYLQAASLSHGNQAVVNSPPQVITAVVGDTATAQAVATNNSQIVTGPFTPTGSGVPADTTYIPPGTTVSATIPSATYYFRNVYPTAITSTVSVFDVHFSTVGVYCVDLLLFACDTVALQQVSYSYATFLLVQRPDGSLASQCLSNSTFSGTICAFQQDLSKSTYFSILLVPTATQPFQVVSSITISAPSTDSLSGLSVNGWSSDRSSAIIKRGAHY